MLLFLVSFLKTCHFTLAMPFTFYISQYFNEYSMLFLLLFDINWFFMVYTLLLECSFRATKVWFPAIVA